MWKPTEVAALEQHMDTLAVAIAEAGRRPPELYGDIPSTPEAVRRWVDRLSAGGARLRFCYEAGPCGCGPYRQLTQLGYECAVVAPSMTPPRPGATGCRHPGARIWSAGPGSVATRSRRSPGSRRSGCAVATAI